MLFKVISVLFFLISFGLSASESSPIRRDPEFIRFEVHDGIGKHNYLKVVFIDSVSEAKEERSANYYLGFDWIPDIREIVTHYENLREEALIHNRRQGRVEKLIQLDMSYVQKIRKKGNWTTPYGEYYAGAEKALTIIDAPSHWDSSSSQRELKEQLSGILTQHLGLQKKLTETIMYLKSGDSSSALQSVQEAQEIQEGIFSSLVKTLSRE